MNTAGFSEESVLKCEFYSFSIELLCRRFLKRRKKSCPENNNV